MQARRDWKLHSSTWLRTFSIRSIESGDQHCYPKKTGLSLKYGLSVLEGLKMAHQKGPQSHNQITILKRQKYGTAGKTEKVERPVAYKFRFEVLEVEPAKTKNVKTENVDAQKQTNLDSKH